MAMEVKMLEVKNSEEQSTIEFWAQFGWQLKSSQRIYNKDSHLEQRGDSVYSVTETVDFTKLILERDKCNPNYSKITRLESEYLYKLQNLPSERPSAGKTYTEMESWASSTKPDVRSKMQKVLFFLLLFGGIALLLLLEPFNSTFTIALQVVGIVMMIAAFVTRSIFKKSMLKKALNGEYPAGVDELNSGFEAYKLKNADELKKVREYDDTISRMRKIIIELQDLI